MLNKNQLTHESVTNVCTSANIRKMLPLAATGATPGSIKLKLGYDHNSVVQLGNQTMAQVILFRHNLGEGELISSPQSERKEPQGKTILPILSGKVYRHRYLRENPANSYFTWRNLNTARFYLHLVAPGTAVSAVEDSFIRDLLKSFLKEVFKLRINNGTISREVGNLVLRSQMVW